MKIILTETLDNLGDAGSVVDVKDGYARNFLIPRNLALVASRGNMKVYEELKRQKEARDNRAQREAVALSKKLEKASCTIPVAVGKEDQIFGSVTTQHISEHLVEQGFEIDRRFIELEEPIRALGVYDVSIRLHADVSATVKVWVVKE
ncbi:MAG: 50S ribosomal protein L9 [Gemmatimonadetes bacterium]|nr:50S ribosomal protein L9 [Gemmatimonadota bacterium]